MGSRHAFALHFSCRPIIAAFNYKAQKDPKTVCNPKNYNVLNIYGFCNIIADFLLLAMPMPMLWTLHMPSAKKFGLARLRQRPTVSVLSVHQTFNPNICIRICAIAILRQYMLYNPPYKKDFSRQMIITKIWMYVDLLAAA